MQLESLPNTALRWITSTQKLFSQPLKVWIHRPGQTEKPDPNSRVYWVLSRRATRQTAFTFPADIPEGKRKALLRVQVRRWAPFPNAKYVAQWSGNRASVYAWNDDEVRQAISDAGLSERRAVVYPEAFVRSPMQNGARLVPAIEGFEAQVWQEGFLAFSRWWPHQPSQLEWTLFLRSAGVSSDHQRSAAPEPATADFLDSPWIRQDGYLGGSWSVLEDPRYAIAGAALLATPFIYLGTEYITLAVSNTRVQSQIETLSAETQGIRKIRSEAITNLDEIEDFLSLEIYPSQFEILTMSLGLLQPLNVKIPEWTYDVGSLSITLRPQKDVDPSFLITTFEKVGFFANVTASRVGQDGHIRMRMDVLPKPTKTASR